MSLVASGLLYTQHACNTGDCAHWQQDECDAELSKLKVIDCPIDCSGCSCFQNPPCAHCTDGHGYIAEEEHG